MGLAERLERWHALMQRLRDNDIGHWSRTYLHALEKGTDRVPVRSPVQDDS
ncbi:hypothetical protein D3C83_161260 [compost metagenome]